MRAIIPCAGNGERFGLKLPKSLLEIRGKSILQHIIDKMLFDSIVIVNDSIIEHFYQYDNVYSTGNKNGTGCLNDLWGYIKNRPFDDTLIVVGDIFFDFDVLQICSKEEITVPVMSRKLHNPGMAVIVDSELCINRLTDIGEYYELGIYYIPKDKLYLIGECVEMYDKDRPCKLIEYVCKKHRVIATLVNGMWQHIITKEDYEAIT